ncbi:alpha/beta-hydrolase [Hypoxylon cercidicola]|nr:alpha/beta-hydrolase [Hypoxylon cercidicola]
MANPLLSRSEEVLRYFYIALSLPFLGIGRLKYHLSPSTPRWSSQPYKALYSVFFTLKLPFFVTATLIQYLFPSARPHPEWSLKMAFVGAYLKAGFEYQEATRNQQAPQLTPGKVGDRFRTIQPPEPFSRILVGPCESAAVIPKPVTGCWWPSPLRQEDAKDQKVVLYVPGGAFVLGWDIDVIVKDIGATMARHAKATKTFYVQYRLARDQGSCFPAALQDVVTVYHHVLSLGVKPENLILCGDSAGGSLVLAAVRYLETYQSRTGLPLPAGVMSFSPWVHVTRDAGHEWTASSNSDKDYLPAALLQWGAEAYLPKHVSPEVAPFLSPLHRPYKSSVPILVHAGTVEGLHDQAEEFASEMAAAGSPVRFRSTKLSPHDLLLLHGYVGSTAELDKVIADGFDLIGWDPDSPV